MLILRQLRGSCLLPRFLAFSSKNRDIASATTTTKTSSISFLLEYKGVQSVILDPLIFTPSGISIGIRNPAFRKEIFELPLTNKKIECPLSQQISKIIDDLPKIEQSIDLPTISNGVSDQGKQAARLIVIRRRKMKKHKLRKLRKKMKFEWAKVRQRRELRKEKRFQAGLISQIKEAEKFSAAQYVAEKLRLATETPIPRLWKGKRLPQFLIKEKLGIK